MLLNTQSTVLVLSPVTNVRILLNGVEIWSITTELLGPLCRGASVCESSTLKCYRMGNKRWPQ